MILIVITIPRDVVAALHPLYVAGAIHVLHVRGLLVRRQIADRNVIKVYASRLIAVVTNNPDLVHKHVARNHHRVAQKLPAGRMVIISNNQSNPSMRKIRTRTVANCSIANKMIHTYKRGKKRMLLNFFHSRYMINL